MKLLMGENAQGQKRDLKQMANAHRHTNWVQKNPTYRPYLVGLSSFCVQGWERCSSRMKTARYAQLNGLFSALTYSLYGLNKLS